MTELPFFFYGSFAEGMVHHRKVQNFVRSAQAATISGTAYRLQVGFPVVFPQGSDVIPGTLVTLEASELLLSLLDQFHGIVPFDDAKSLFWRRETQVRTADGQIHLASVYFGNPDRLPKTARIIDNGDWATSLMTEEPLTAKLTERQKEYIHRLAGISGREIVPINDLTLYRELMKMELIVDKGRRLALSKFGHEVCRYLD